MGWRSIVALALRLLPFLLPALRLFVLTLGRFFFFLLLLLGQVDRDILVADGDVLLATIDGGAEAGRRLDLHRLLVLGDGDLPTAIRASMAVPAAFAPVQIEDRLLVDGGVSMNLPVSVVRDMGADIVIAVDISTPSLRRDQIKSALDMVNQLSAL